MKARTNDAKRKWHWGLGLIHMYSRLMVDFISKSHCYAMSVLLQQNEYCIFTGSVCIYYVTINEKYIYIHTYFFNTLSSLLFSVCPLGKERKLNYILPFVVKFIQSVSVYNIDIFPTFVPWNKQLWGS